MGEKLGMSDNHNKTADKLAKKLKTKHRHEGVDIISKGRAIEVAITKEDIYQSVGQLNRSRAQKKYMAVPSKLIPDTKKILQDTGIGIMNTQGKIKKRSRKK